MDKEKTGLIYTMEMKNLKFDSGSFRDPTGFVFYVDDEVYRAIDSISYNLLRQLYKENILTKLIENKFIVDTKILTNKDPIQQQIEKLIPNNSYFLQHNKIPVITYPYEWPFSMLADAAVKTLELQKKLIKLGYSLKDASAYNIQFINTQPIFIDVTSIEKPFRQDIWIAYGQFCRMFLFPLLLRKHRHINTKGYFLADIEGMNVEQVFRVLGKISSLKPSLFFDIFLQNYFQRIGKTKTSKLKKSISERSSNYDSQLFNLNRMLRIIRKISKKSKSFSPWVNYTQAHSYTEEAEKIKENYISYFLRKYRPKTVLDLGANTGKYSLLASDAGSDVIAIDSDHESINRVFLQAKNKSANVLPLWIDIANTSPALGFENMERKSFLDRIQCDCVFALALLHHLLITSRIPITKLRDYFYNLTDKYLIIEFIDSKDEMFQKLLELREDIYDHITLNNFSDIFQEKFILLEQNHITDTKRTLCTFRKRV